MNLSTNALWDFTEVSLENQNKLIYAGLILLAIVAVIGIAILWNQRKIKKMLRELQEQKNKEDKP